jgi:hypothetical protein
VLSEDILLKQEQLHECGLIIIMGLPSVTSVHQKMDALYGPFKSSMCAPGEKVVQDNIRIRGVATRNGDKLPMSVLNLDINDLASIVHDRPKNISRDRPFNFNLTKEKILWSWEKVGFMPFTRKCLNKKRVRKELGQRNKQSKTKDSRA